MNGEDEKKKGSFLKVAFGKIFKKRSSVASDGQDDPNHNKNNSNLDLLSTKSSSSINLTTNNNNPPSQPSRPISQPPSKNTSSNTIAPKKINSPFINNDKGTFFFTHFFIFKN